MLDVQDSKLARWIDDHLANRRQAGFALAIEGEQLWRFARFAEQAGHHGRLTVRLASTFFCGPNVIQRRGAHFERAVAQDGAHTTVTVDKGGANLAGLHAINAQRERPIRIRQTKYLYNVLAQARLAIKRRARPMLGFKYFHCARILLAGIKLMHILRKEQCRTAQGSSSSTAERFYALAE